MYVIKEIPYSSKFSFWKLWTVTSSRGYKLMGCTGAVLYIVLARPNDRGESTHQKPMKIMGMHYDIQYL